MRTLGDLYASLRLLLKYHDIEQSVDVEIDRLADRVDEYLVRGRADADRWGVTPPPSVDQNRSSEEHDVVGGTRSESSCVLTVMPSRPQGRGTWLRPPKM